MPSAFGAVLEADSMRERRMRASAQPDTVPAPSDLEQPDALLIEDRPARDEDYCDWSFLRKEQCAGPCCLNHYIDPELLEANKP